MLKGAVLSVRGRAGRVWLRQHAPRGSLTTAASVHRPAPGACSPPRLLPPRPLWLPLRWPPLLRRLCHMSHRRLYPFGSSLETLYLARIMDSNGQLHHLLPNCTRLADLTLLNEESEEVELCNNVWQMPSPNHPFFLSGVYKDHKELRATQGVKIVARGLQYAMAGTSLIVVKPGDDLRQAEAAAMQGNDMAISTTDEKKGTSAQEVSSIKTCKEGLYVQASSIGTLEAIIEHLKSNTVDIPVSDWNLGPVHKQDVMKATAMLKRKEEYAAILAFDVKVTPEASALAAESGVKIITADTVYKLVDRYTEQIKGLKEARKMQCAAEAVFPCILKILPNRVYHKKDPIVCDVEVVEGVVKVGTPICVSTPSKDKRGDIVHSLGKISSMKTSSGNQIFSARNGVLSIKISGDNPQEKSLSYGRHFDSSNELLSQISRRSIDVVKRVLSG